MSFKGNELRPVHLQDDGSSPLLQGDDVPATVVKLPNSCWYVALWLIAGFCALATLSSTAIGALASYYVNSTATFECGIFRDLLKAGTYGAPVFLIFGPALIGCNRARFRALGSSPNVSCGKKLFVFGSLYFTYFLLFVVFAALTVFSGIMYDISQSVPDLNRNLSGSLSGLDGPIRIDRDENGLTHVYAASQLDAVFGQGFVHAQDRLWEMEFQRLVVKGVLAEHVGEAALNFDKQTRTLNFVKASEMLCANMTADQIQYFQRYVDGINFYLNNYEQRPPEFLLMSKKLLAYHEPEPYTIMDVCYSSKILQWRLSFNVDLEVERFKIFWRTSRSYDDIWELYFNQTNISNTVLTAAQMNLTEEDAVAARAREARDREIESRLYNPGGLFHALREQYSSQSDESGSDDDSSDDGDDGVFLLKSSAKLEEVQREEHDARFGKGAWDILKIIPGKASNAWVARAPFGAPNQASDPHLDLNLPSIWYFTHLHFPGFNAAGVGLVGVPGVHIGKTDHVSWGITMSLTDLEDLYFLIPSETTPDTKYNVNGVDIPFTYRTEVIHVKGGDTVTLTVKDSIYGPVCSAALGLPKHLNFAIKSQALIDDRTSVTSIYNLLNPNVTTAIELRDMAFSQMQSPGFSIPSTDKDGNLVYFLTGRHIKRAVGHTGTLPTIGNGTFDWKGYIPYAELPTLVIPGTEQRDTGAAISAANQKVHPDGYAYTLGYDYCVPDRGSRLHELVNPTSAASGNLSDVDYHMGVQSDVMSNAWRFFYKPLLTLGVDHAGRLVRQNMSAAFRYRLNVNGRAVFDELTLSWDGKARRSSTSPTFLWFWIRQIGYVPKDAIKATRRHTWTDFYYPHTLLSNPTAHMTAQCVERATEFGYAQYPELTPCLSFAVGAWNAMADQYNPAPLWGVEVNLVHATNLMLADTPLSCLFDRKIGKDGDQSSINVADPGSMKGKIPIVAGPSMRQVYTWAVPSLIHFALPGGESGNPFSWRYQNLLQNWANKVYVDASLASTPAATANTTSTQTIQSSP